MESRSHPIETIRYLAITVATFLCFQALIVITHEFTHSTMAWLLGEMESPLGIVWGNPIMMTGWDEGVEYQRIFKHGPAWHGAIIGICPLIMHSTLAAIAIHLMRGQWLYQRKWLFHCAYWLTIVNFMELIAYVYMRAFSGHGDIGNFDRGLDISPWWVFIIGSAALTWGLLLFFRTCLPRLQTLFAHGNRFGMWTILALTSILLFLWGSGIRVMAYVPGPQWMFGLIGIVGFMLTAVLFRPRSTE